jgi:RNA polymerase sigma factor (sigma-70 family)
VAGVNILEEQGAVKETQASQEATFLRLYEQYGPAVWRLVNAYTGDAPEREDLFQEIATQLWRALPNYRGQASERTWLYRIAHNVAITATAKSRHRGRAEVELTELPHRGPGIEEALLASERQSRLAAAIRELPVVDRQLVVLHLEGLSHAEIAEVLGTSPGAAMTRLSRVRDRLVRMLNQGGGNE